ncbi:hypothetical protein ACHAWF_015972 [Thalassiosira exigua]
MFTLNPAVEAGTPSKEFREDNGWVMTPVYFHGFEELPTTRDVCIRSPEFECFRHRWLVLIYPGGVQSSDDGMVGVYLKHVSAENIDVQYSIGYKSSNMKEVCRKFGEKYTFPGYCTKGFTNFTTRSDIIDALVGGAWAIVIGMRCKELTTYSQPFINENPLSTAIPKMLMDKETADVIFEIEGGDDTPTAKFHAHRLILKHCAPYLDELAGSESGSNSITINDVQPKVFRLMLHYVYGRKLTDDDLKSSSKDIIDAADKFGVVNLKLEAEAWYLKSTKIGIDNVLELLLYADSKNCALLKEAAMDFIVANKAEVIEKVSFGDAPGDIASDILAAVMRWESGGVGGEMSAMRISELRKKLHEKGLEIDGSRETLIARLKGNA